MSVKRNDSAKNEENAPASSKTVTCLVVGRPTQTEYEEEFGETNEQIGCNCASWIVLKLRLLMENRKLTFIIAKEPTLNLFVTSHANMISTYTCK